MTGAKFEAAGLTVTVKVEDTDLFDLSVATTVMLVEPGVRNCNVSRLLNVGSSAADAMAGLVLLVIVYVRNSVLRTISTLLTTSKLAAVASVGKLVPV